MTARCRPLLSRGRRHTLIINLTDSRCGNCGYSAHPDDTTHTRLLGTGGPGCGERWVFVTSDYRDADGHLYERIRAMRPDLEPDFPQDPAR